MFDLLAERFVEFVTNAQPLHVVNLGISPRCGHRNLARYAKSASPRALMADARGAIQRGITDVLAPHLPVDDVTAAAPLSQDPEFAPV
jgi:hypothetical protein